MKVSLSWLQQYTAVTMDPETLAARLTMAGLEVESVENRYTHLEKVVVGFVESVSPHPKADRLSCCVVDVGQDTPLSIVCGAPNVRPGLKVPCALVGAVLPGGLVIKKSKLRGEPSQGMLCSAVELGLGADAGGIMELETDARPGTPLTRAMGLSDACFEIDLTPNRPDCLSVIGVAREVAAFSGTSLDLTPPELPPAPTGHAAVSDRASVTIEDPDLCHRYTAAMVENVTVEPSPWWLQDRLLSVGMTPINNIVDVTNFVMMEMGQPLHAFDYDFLKQGRVVVRRMGCTERFTTLDGKEHTLDPDMLMICDGERPVGIAGVMGGENSEIVPKTTRVLIESAYFNPVSVRRTAKLCGINSDASHRFERGVDPEGCITALKRAAALIASVGGGTLVEGIIDEKPVPYAPVEILLKSDALNRRLGTDLTPDEIGAYLGAVGFGIDLGEDHCLKVGVPSFRVDVSRPEDLSEEVARLWGYNNIQTRFPVITSETPMPARPVVFREGIRDLMSGFGFFEAINYSFTDAGVCRSLELPETDERQAMEQVLNPISEEMSVLRTSLLPGLMQTMGRNLARQTDTLRLFEVGHIFLATSPGRQPVEREMLAGLWTGGRHAPTWHAKQVPCDFFDLKGVVEGLLSSLDIDPSAVAFEPAPPDSCPYYVTGAGALIRINGTDIGSIGEISGAVRDHFDLRQPLFMFEMEMAKLMAEAPENVTSRPLPRFPAVERDITMIVPETVPAGRVLGDLEAYLRDNKLVESCFLFDVYQGKPLEEGKKSLSFRIVYRSAEATLKEKRVKKLHTTISRWLVDQYQAELPA